MPESKVEVNKTDESHETSPQYDALKDKKLIDFIRSYFLKSTCESKADYGYNKFDSEIIDSAKSYGYEKNDIKKVLNFVKKHLNEDEIGEIRKLKFEKPLVVPPGLNIIVTAFEAHYAVSGDDPIMILGATGVGKSLLLYLSKQLFKDKHKYDLTPPAIIEANCAHFSSGDGSYSLARSELFGHARGSYTGAYKEKKGLVEEADGGLLVLEEVGELPFEVQAMLLTFIETGEYRRLGDEKLRRANVKIVAATNRESALRDDFRYRFFSFHISPLNERKEDILYYFEAIFPDLFYKLTKSEVLLLLTHHWPGNVRELERIGKLLSREKWLYQEYLKSNQDGDVPPPNDRLFHLNPKDTSFNPRALYELGVDLGKWNVDVAFLEKLLKPYSVSIDSRSNKVAFVLKKKLDSEEESVFFGNYMLKYCNFKEAFTQAYTGYFLFCELFLQAPNKQENIISTIRDNLQKPQEILTFPYFYHLVKHFEPLTRLRKQIVKYLFKVKTAEYDDLDDAYLIWIGLTQKQRDSEKSLNENRAKKIKDALDVMSELPEEELQKLYYSRQIQKTGGNIKAAAKLIGLHENTFRSRLKKLGIDYHQF